MWAVLEYDDGDIVGVRGPFHSFKDAQITANAYLKETAKRLKLKGRVPVLLGDDESGELGDGDAYAVSLYALKAP